MKHIDLYIAEDGKQFDNYEDCAFYEFNCIATAGQFVDRIKFFDREGNSVDVLDPSKYENVWCIIPMDEHIMVEYYEAYYNSGIDICADYLPEPISRPECYYSPDCILVYQGECDEWENLTEKLEQVKNELEYWRNK